MPFAAMWMDLEIIILSEEREKDKEGHSSPRGGSPAPDGGKPR